MNITKRVKAVASSKRPESIGQFAVFRRHRLFKAARATWPALKAFGVSDTTTTSWKNGRERSMLGLFRVTKFGAALILTAILLTAAPSRSYAETGSVRMKVTKVGFIVGVGGGTGTLTFKGRQYRFRVGGVSAGTIGVAGMDLVGTASNLRTAADIAGAYSAASAGIAVAGGARVATLQNSKGVVLQLQGRQVGFEASLSLSGLTISLR